MMVVTGNDKGFVSLEEIPLEALFYQFCHENLNFKLSMDDVILWIKDNFILLGESRLRDLVDELHKGLDMPDSIIICKSDKLLSYIFVKLLKTIIEWENLLTVKEVGNNWEDTLINLTHIQLNMVEDIDNKSTSIDSQQTLRALTQCGGLKNIKTRWNEFKLLLFFKNEIIRSDINGENIYAAKCDGFTDNPGGVCEKCIALTTNKSFTSNLSYVKRRIKNNPELDIGKPIMPVCERNLTPCMKLIKDQVTKPVTTKFQEKLDKMKVKFENEKEKMLRENILLKKTN